MILNELVVDVMYTYLVLVHPPPTPPYLVKFKLETIYYCVTVCGLLFTLQV